VRQNKWRATRYGLAANLVNSDTYDLQPARDVATDLIVRLQPVAKELDCANYLEHAESMARGTTWAERQLEVYRQSRDPREVVRRMIAHSRLSPAA
jgi:carboxylate-amine ligase